MCAAAKRPRIEIRPNDQTRRWEYERVVSVNEIKIKWFWKIYHFVAVHCSVWGQFSCITKRYDLNIYVFLGRNYLIWYSILLCIHFGNSLRFLQIYLACCTIRSRHEITTHCRHEQKERKKPDQTKSVNCVK